MQTKTLKCQTCGVECPRSGPSQRYCPPCSTDRDRIRKKLFAREHPLPREKGRKKEADARSRAIRNGIARSAQSALGILWHNNPKLKWIVRFMVPFSYAASKNHIFTLRNTGHLELRGESNKLLKLIADKTRRAVAGEMVVRAKVWIDLLVQKSNHKGDAINVIELVCDGIKEGLGVDDRWFCIRRLDWQIVKTDPQIIIGIGQESSTDRHVCSYCGRVLKLSRFTKDSDAVMGVGRECRKCRSKTLAEAEPPKEIA